MKESILEGSKFDLFRAELEMYVRDNPRTWESLVACRQTSFDTNLEKISVSFSFRHRSSWQNSARVNEDRAALLRCIHKTAKKMGIQYKSPPLKRLIFQGGSYKPSESHDFLNNEEPDLRSGGSKDCIRGEDRP